jgi:hypothetical protein
VFVGSLVLAFSVLIRLTDVFTMCNICSVGTLTHKPSVSSVSSLYSSVILRFVRVFVNTRDLGVMNSLG